MAKWNKRAGLAIHLVSLGCSKNLVDSERLLGQAIRDLGMRATENPEEADLLAVNTCAFIQEASREAVETIFELKSKARPGVKLAVLGCLAARYGKELSGLMPEADMFLAPPDYQDFTLGLASLLGLSQPQRPGSFETWERLSGTPPWRSYLKISEGCDRHCSYCLIPSLRGPLRCRPLSELLSEARSLSEGGVTELTLVAQDLTAWRDGSSGLLELATALDSIPGIQWLRLMYAYPEGLRPALVRGLSQLEKAVPYLDIPLQHASPSVLRRMGRGQGRPLETVKSLRERWPGLALRTTLMVGFPGESPEDFQLLLDLVEKAEFDNLGVFKFSPEEGARAASFPEQVPQVIKERRRRKVMSLQKKISRKLNRARLGQVCQVLVEGPGPDSPLVMTGRAPFQAPEVDGLIYFDGPQPRPGQMVRARLIKAGTYDLVARLEQAPF
jgi:ribosomal protein S12 methylthiotransferase